MKNNKNIIICLSLFIVVAFSMLLFFCTGESIKNGIEISAFTFVFITELLAFINVMFIVNKKLNTFVIAGLSSTSFLYTVCSILFNVLLLGLFSTIKSILVFNFSILFIYLFLNMMIFLFKKGDEKYE